MKIVAGRMAGGRYAKQRLDQYGPKQGGMTSHRVKKLMNKENLKDNASISLNHSHGADILDELRTPKIY